MTTVEPNAEVLNVGILPVSGGAFPMQLAGLTQMCQTNHKFDVILASSGGNVAAYLAMAGGWHWAGLKRMIKQMRAEWFSRPWSFWPLSSWYSYTNRCMRAAGTGTLDFMMKNFSSSSVKQTEIWTGVCNKTTERTRLYCNRGRDEVQLCPSPRHLLVANQEDPIYADGDLGLIARYCLASASIPHVVPAVEIGGDYFVDGGMAAASPLSILATEIENHPAKVINLTYFSYGDMECRTPQAGSGIASDLLGTLNTLIKFLAVMDRRRACEIIAKRGPIKTVQFMVNWEILTVVEELRQITGSSMLELYSTCVETVDIHSVDPEVIQNLMHRAESCLCARFWYVTKDQAKEKVLLRKIRDLELETFRKCGVEDMLRACPFDRV